MKTTRLQQPIKKNIHRNQAGFTIVELMIATAVFATVLVVITIGIIHFSRGYYRGVYTSQTQTAARQAVDTISQAVQFGTATVNAPQTSIGGDKYIFCAGGYVFVYELGKMYRPNQASNNGFYTQPMHNGSCAEQGNSDGRRQLLGDKMRVANLSFTSEGRGVYTISMRLAYGEDELLTATSGNNVQCRSGAGSEYCAVVALRSSAQQRLFK